MATATAIALMVDAARMPVYFVTEADAIRQAWRYVVLGIVGVVIGTIVGQRVLVKVPEKIFRRLISVIILALGVALMVHPKP